MICKLLVTAAVAVVLAGAATAQTDGQRIVIERASNPPRQEGQVRVQASINLFIPGSTSDNEEGVRNRERARRVVYEMASKECDLLREVLAKECRLETINTNMHRQSGQALEGYNVTGQMSMQITLK